MKSTEAAMAGAERLGYGEAEMKVLFEEITSHKWVTVNENDPSDWSINEFEFKGRQNTPEMQEVVNAAMAVKGASADVARRDAEICARDAIPLFNTKGQFDNIIVMNRMASSGDDTGFSFTQEQIDDSKSNFMEMLFAVDNVMRMDPVEIIDGDNKITEKGPPSFEQMQIYIKEAIDTAKSDASFASLDTAEQSTRQRTFLRNTIISKYYQVGGDTKKSFNSSTFENKFSKRR